MWRLVFIGLLLISIACKREESTVPVEDFGQTRKELDRRLEEINKLANSKNCLDSTQWNFTAYGSKACGGPQGYIAFSVELDTVAFLQKVKEYTALEDEYNRKAGIVSTCELPAEPSGIRCENGKPVFLY